MPNIEVTKVRSNEVLAVTGGEYAITDTEIFVDDRLSEHDQRDRVIHAVIETYCPFLCHDKVEELTELILEGLDSL